MRKASPSKILGLKLKDMAMILGVTQSQYSMYESGLRSLPTHASVLLSEMLTHVNHNESTARKNQPVQNQHIALHTTIEKMVRENEYQQLITAKKIETATKQYEAGLRRSKLAGFFDVKRDMKVKSAAGIVTFKQKREDNDEPEVKLFLLKHKLEMLKHENKLLQEKLKYLTKYQ